MGNKKSSLKTSIKALDDDGVKFHENMVLCEHNRDIEKYYDFLETLKEGSMGSISKAKRKESKIGGSAYSNKYKKKLKGDITERPKSFSVGSNREFAVKSIIQSRVSVRNTGLFCNLKFCPMKCIFLDNKI